MNKFANYVFTEKLRLERYRHKLHIRQMAKLMGMSSHVSYKNLEEGLVEPRITSMVKVASILGKPVKYFFNLNVQNS